MAPRTTSNIPNRLHRSARRNRKWVRLPLQHRSISWKDGIYSPEIIAGRATEIIAANNPDVDPLYLYLPFQSVHAPIEVPKKYENMYPNIHTEVRRKYCGMVTALDEAVGKNGGPTYLGANNLPLRGAKTTLWKEGKGALLSTVKLYSTRQPTTTIKMIHAVDWFPTILQLAGGSPSPSLDGVSQWNTISNNTPSARNEFVYNIDELDNNAAIRVGDYKLIKGSPGAFNGWYPLPGLDHTFQDYSYFIPKTQLFNIKDDPTEHHNLADDMPEVVAKLENRLAQYMKSLVPALYPKPNPKIQP
ncbi:hypothetical protein ScPMuIL_015604 [Solemya velum]